jgi:two-component system, OmpR family, KDP operon response regulator KdpE
VTGIVAGRANSLLKVGSRTFLSYPIGVANITVIEDDHRIREALVRALTLRGHIVSEFSKGFSGLDHVISSPPDVLVLDLGLPDIDGRDLLIELRKVSMIPVIVATARDDDQEVVSTLHAGADDYIIKPFSAEQLDARIVALLRRTRTPEGTPIIEVGGLRIDPRHHEVRMDGELIDLNRKEFELLAYLAARPGIVTSKQELLAEVWRQPWGGSEKTVDVHLSWLRRKLGETAQQPRYISAVRGVGVKLVVPSG